MTEQKQNYFYFFRFLKPYILLIVCILLISVLYTVLRTISMLIIPEILVSLDPSYKAPNLSEVGDGLLDIDFLGQFKSWMYAYTKGFSFIKRIETMAIIVAILFILKNIIDYIRRILTAWFEVSVVTDMRSQIFEHMVNLSMNDLEKKKSGHFLSILTGDVMQVFISMKRVLENLVTEPLFIISVIYSIILISWKLSLLILFAIPVSALVLTIIGRSLTRKSKRVLLQTDKYLAIINETLNGFKTFKSYFAESFQKNRYIVELLKLKKLQFLQSTIISLNIPAAEIVGSFLVAGIIILGAHIQSDEGLRNADLVTILLSLILLLEPAKKIGTVYNEIKMAMVSIERVADIIKTERDDDSFGNIEKEVLDDKIEFSIIKYKHSEKSKFSLKNLNFEIKKGETVALVGHSGSGKTTVAELLARFSKITDGSIKIDGVELNDIKASSLRSLISVVSQDSFLINDSIKNNIWFQSEDVDENRMVQAADMANAKEFIDNFPEKFDHVIDERGNNLSGGQKQRISIARAILRDSPIIIFDEATSALDSESEKKVQDAIEKAMKDKTVLVIAHRLSTIINSDKIIVMDHGEIVEMGKHDELIKKNGAYRKLYDIQFRKSSK
jgi:ATP-binding cassette, subfamily B, bacterial MsbA